MCLSSKINIVIVTYNNKSILKRTLPGIVSEAFTVNAGIIIVDNNSRDGTAQWISRKYKTIRVVALPVNSGFAKANNVGIGMCRSKYVLLLNPDVIVPPQSITKILEWMDRNPSIGIAGPKLLNENGTIQYSCRRFPTLFSYFAEIIRFDNMFPKSRFGRRYLMKDYDHKTPCDVDYICGAVMLIRAEVFAKVGLLDEAFFMYAEEAELCWRAFKNNFRVAYWPITTMIHIGGESSKSLHKEMYSENIRSRWLFFKRTKGMFLAMLYLMTAVMYSIITGKEICSQLWRK